MTNEKAIMCLEDMKIKVPIPKAAKQARENNEALDVAIKALQSAQPKTNCSESPNTSDCISRQAAIDALKDWYDGMLISSFRGIAKVIDALPPAEPKMGWWIEIINSRGVVVALRCSRCEKSPRHGVRSDFCPNCGADMREVTE